MILSGEKKHEYRKLNYYWANRIFDIPEERKQEFRDSFNDMPSLSAVYCRSNFNYKDRNSVIFANGMKPPESKPVFEIELVDIFIGPGKEEWGAKKGEVYFCIEVGNVISKANC